ncbi:hypothetical protein ACHAWF_008083, partial [Thalassiosira exigua]
RQTALAEHHGNHGFPRCRRRDGRRERRSPAAPDEKRGPPRPRRRRRRRPPPRRGGDRPRPARRARGRPLRLRVGDRRRRAEARGGTPRDRREEEEATAASLPGARRRSPIPVGGEGRGTRRGTTGSAIVASSQTSTSSPGRTTAGATAAKLVEAGTANCETVELAQGVCCPPPTDGPAEKPTETPANKSTDAPAKKPTTDSPTEKPANEPTKEPTTDAAPTKAPSEWKEWSKWATETSAAAEGAEGPPPGSCPFCPAGVADPKLVLPTGDGTTCAGAQALAAYAATLDDGGSDCAAVELAEEFCCPSPTEAPSKNPSKRPTEAPARTPTEEPKPTPFPTGASVDVATTPASASAAAFSALDDDWDEEDGEDLDGGGGADEGWAAVGKASAALAVLASAFLLGRRRERYLARVARLVGRGRDASPEDGAGTPPLEEFQDVHRPLRRRNTDDVLDALDRLSARPRRGSLNLELPDRDRGMSPDDSLDRSSDGSPPSSAPSTGVFGVISSYHDELRVIDDPDRLDFEDDEGGEGDWRTSSHRSGVALARPID